MRTTRTLVGATLAWVLTLAGCVAGDTTSTTTSSVPTTSTTSVPTSTLPPVVECPGTGEFEEGSGIAEIEGEGSGTQLRHISWETSDRCESFSFDFETSEGAPATALPDMRIDHLETFQVIRIRMGIDTASVTDQLVETALVDRLFVVRALDGTMFVDLHLNEPTAARARVESSPARLTLDLRPGFLPFTGQSTVGEEVVVVSPARDSEVGLVTQLQGYARNTEGEVLVVVTRDDEVLIDSTTPVVDSPGWGEFFQEVALTPGETLVFIGRPIEDGISGIEFNLTSG